MNVSYCNQYIQIELFEGSRFLSKVLEYANKHFSQHYHLSSSLLILDDGEKFKKDYLINWAYHISLQGIKLDKENLDVLLSHSHLPMRIKIVKRNEILQKIKISLCAVGYDKVVLKMDKTSRVAKRYLKSVFGQYCVFESGDTLYLSSVQEDFWEMMIDIIGSKVIHNVVIDFDYEGFGTSLTQEEYLLRKCYMELCCAFGDDFESVKKSYLKLARLYHPDNAYGEDESIIASYEEHFRKINEAYEIIKKSHKNNKKVS
ncbi:DnaJ domain-containing protein [Helicobacter sp. 13S00477-4]|uniref:J domain-containing protein n=1 Tax=Helicobacter sp. 13S00477-4 TaxID=1905759 RepID=UPI000BA605ED|nr:DnaJ domain-containing protein [Helicobacter sp. 13S00477-4]PAF52149.1 hypothetical protein BKH44_03340 [Helicobacter sp. 13S00477-4]